MIIYLITNKVNEKRYVGQTTQSLKKRHWQHINDALVKKYPYPLHCAIRKYGPENFNVRVLLKCNSMEELNHREGYLIRLFNTHISNNNGYNIRFGGSNSFLSEDTKIKMSIAATGRIKSLEERAKLSIANSGKKLTREHKEKLRIASTKRILTSEEKKKISDSKRGKPRSKETKKKLSLANLGKKFNEETIKKLRLCRTNIVPVKCLETSKIYPSMNEAARQMGLSVHQIMRSVDGKKIKATFTFKRVSHDV